MVITKRLTFEVREDLHKIIKSHAVNKDSSIGEIMTEMIECWIKEQGTGGKNAKQK